jgi:hypothetical protein
MNTDIFSNIAQSVKDNYTKLGIITVSASVIVGVLCVGLVIKDLLTKKSGS